jgi:hypothetical protein
VTSKGEIMKKIGFVIPLIACIPPLVAGATAGAQELGDHETIGQLRSSTAVSSVSGPSSGWGASGLAEPRRDAVDKRLPLTTEATEPTLLSVGGTVLNVFPHLAPPSSNCYQAAHGPGCDVVACETTVCGIDPYCCTTEWDSNCVDAADDNCAGSVSIATDTVDSAFRLVVGGNAAKPGGGSWSVLSDSRAKRDITPVGPGMLDRLLSLHAYEFRYREEALRPGVARPGIHTGLLAQEVAEVLPEWVDRRSDGYLYVTERAVTAIFVEALRDLRQEKEEQIRALEAENSELWAEVRRLQRAVSALPAAREVDARRDLLTAD